MHTPSTLSPLHLQVEKLRSEIDLLMTEKLLELTPQMVRDLLEEVMRKHPTRTLTRTRTRTRTRTLTSTLTLTLKGSSASA